MSDYTPTIDQLRDWYTAAAGRTAAPEEFDRALAAHDAEKRAEWEAERLAEQGEVEWEYGISYAPGNEEFEGQDLPTIQRRVKYIRRQGGYYSRTVRAIRRHPAGDAVPVNENGESQ